MHLLLFYRTDGWTMTSNYCILDGIIISTFEYAWIVCFVIDQYLLYINYFISSLILKKDSDIFCRGLNWALIYLPFSLLYFINKEEIISRDLIFFKNWVLTRLPLSVCNDHYANILRLTRQTIAKGKNEKKGTISCKMTTIDG